jgi:hypothetical protein
VRGKNSKAQAPQANNGGLDISIGDEKRSEVISKEDLESTTVEAWFEDWLLDKLEESKTKDNLTVFNSLFKLNALSLIDFRRVYEKNPTILTSLAHKPIMGLIENKIRAIKDYKSYFPLQRAEEIPLKITPFIFSLDLDELGSLAKSIPEMLSS